MKIIHAASCWFFTYFNAIFQYSARVHKLLLELDVFVHAFVHKFCNIHLSLNSIFLSGPIKLLGQFLWPLAGCDQGLSHCPFKSHVACLLGECVTYMAYAHEVAAGCQASSSCFIIFVDLF